MQMHQCLFAHVFGAEKWMIGLAQKNNLVWTTRDYSYLPTGFGCEPVSATSMTGQIVERRKIDGREWLTVSTVADELFDIAKPDVSDERLAQLREMAREVLDEDRAVGNR